MTQEFVTLPREVVEQVLEALEEADLLMEHRQNIELRRSALVALRAALEQPQVEQAPVAWLWVNKQTGAKGVCFEIPTAFHPDYLWRHLYTNPQPQRKPQGEQEPVAWIWAEWSSRNVTFDGPPAVPSVRDELTKPAWAPLYTNPQLQRQPLTDAEIADLLIDLPVLGTGYFLRIARAIEAAHNIK